MPIHGGDTELATASIAQTRQFVRIAGWICVGLGLFAVLVGCLSVLTASAFPDTGPQDETKPVILEFLFSHHYEASVLQVAMGILLAVAGWAMICYRNWGRLLVVAFLCVSIAWALFFLCAVWLPVLLGSLLQGIASGATLDPRLFICVFMILAGTVTTVGLLVVHYLAIRWLCSPGVVAVFRAKNLP